jgi:uncharacterized Tic20 family protein
MSNPDPYYPPSTPQVSPEQERTLGALAHGAALAAMVFSAGTLGFVASLVIYLVYKDRGPFVRRHAANSLNVQLVTLLVVIISLPLMFVLVGFASYAAIMVFAFVVHLIGTIKAFNGEWWDPPLTPHWIK